jgi:hypothetical protein
MLNNGHIFAFNSFIYVELKVLFIISNVNYTIGDDSMALHQSTLKRFCIT